VRVFGALSRLTTTANLDFEYLQRRTETGFEEKIEYETGQFPHESIFNMGRQGGEELLIVVTPNFEEMAPVNRLIEAPVNRLVEERNKFSFANQPMDDDFIQVWTLVEPFDREENVKGHTLLDSAKGKIEEGIDWIKSHRKSQRTVQEESYKKERVEIQEETMQSTPFKSEQLPERASANRFLTSPSIEHREGLDVISIPIDMRSPGGGEVFEELKRRYIGPEMTMAGNEARFSEVMNELTNLPANLVESRLLEMSSGFEQQGGEKITEEPELLEEDYRDLVDIKDEVIIDDYQVEIETERIPEGEIIRTTEEFTLRPVETLMDEEQEVVRVTVTETEFITEEEPEKEGRLENREGLRNNRRRQENRGRQENQDYVQPGLFNSIYDDIIGSC